MTNREKYVNKGFEDESGDCKVCGTKYSSIFDHIATEEHRANYIDALNGPLNLKFKHVGRQSESCVQFVRRHMDHLEKRSQLLSQLQVLANELAF